MHGSSTGKGVGMSVGAAVGLEVGKSVGSSTGLNAVLQISHDNLASIGGGSPSHGDCDAPRIDAHVTLLYASNDVSLISVKHDKSRVSTSSTL